MVTVPPYCPPVNDCSLLCPNGRVRDDDGCFQCRCNPETGNDCSLIPLRQ